MNDDWLWKTAYRIYIFAVFISSAVLIAYILLKVGYVPMTMQNILELSVPGLIYFAPIISIIGVVEFYLVVVIDEFYSSKGNVSKFISAIFGIIIVILIGFFMRLLLKHNIVLFMLSMALILIVPFVLRIAFYKEKNSIRKKAYVFLIAVTFCLLLAVIEYTYANKLFIQENIATEGYGRLLVKENPKRHVIVPMFFRRPYGYDCIPSFIRLDDGLFLLQSARILFQSRSDTLVQYIGFTHGNVPYLHAKNRHHIVSDEKRMCSSKIDLSSSIVRYSDTHKNPMKVCQKIVNQPGKDRAIGFKTCAIDLQNLIAHK